MKILTREKLAQSINERVGFENIHESREIVALAFEIMANRLEAGEPLKFISSSGASSFNLSSKRVRPHLGRGRPKVKGGNGEQMKEVGTWLITKKRHFRLQVLQSVLDEALANRKARQCE